MQQSNNTQHKLNDANNCNKTQSLCQYTSIINKLSEYKQTGNHLIE